jgi:hypothetical protein
MGDWTLNSWYATLVIENGTQRQRTVRIDHLIGPNE